MSDKRRVKAPPPADEAARESDLMDTMAQKFQRTYAKHGYEISPEKAEEVVSDLRGTFGVGFSAAGLEWDEDRILAEVDRLLVKFGPMPLPESG